MKHCSLIFISNVRTAHLSIKNYPRLWSFFVFKTETSRRQISTEIKFWRSFFKHFRSVRRACDAVRHELCEFLTRSEMAASNERQIIYQCPVFSKQRNARRTWNREFPEQRWWQSNDSRVSAGIYYRWEYRRLAFYDVRSAPCRYGRCSAIYIFVCK